MITHKEINNVASQYGLKDTQVEKDYVLTWIVFAVSQNELLSNNLAFYTVFRSAQAVPVLANLRT